eukprot:3940946-Rhodomonas_salina.1
MTGTSASTSTTSAVQTTSSSSTTSTPPPTSTTTPVPTTTPAPIFSSTGAVYATGIASAGQYDVTCRYKGGAENSTSVALDCGDATVPQVSPYAVSGTDLADGGSISLRAPYAVSGTDAAYAATSAGSQCYCLRTAFCTGF